MGSVICNSFEQPDTNEEAHTVNPTARFAGVSQSSLFKKESSKQNDLKIASLKLEIPSSEKNIFRIKSRLVDNPPSFGPGELHANSIRSPNIKFNPEATIVVGSPVITMRVRKQSKGMKMQLKAKLNTSLEAIVKPSGQSPKRGCKKRWRRKLLVSAPKQTS